MSRNLSVVSSDQGGAGRPRSSSGRALTWDGRNPAVRLPPVLMEELELMSHGVAIVRRKSKVTYADIIAWLLDQCPEQVAQVKAMCPPETRAKFAPRVDSLGSPPHMLSGPSLSQSQMATVSAQAGHEVMSVGHEPQLLSHAQQQPPQHTTGIGQPGATSAGRSGSVHWLVPPNVLTRYPASDADLVDNTLGHESLMGPSPVTVAVPVPVPLASQQRIPQGRKQLSQRQLLQQQLQQQPQVPAPAVPTPLQHHHQLHHAHHQQPQQAQQQLPAPSVPPQQPAPPASLQHQLQQHQHHQQQQQPHQHHQQQHGLNMAETDPEGTDVDITIDDTAEPDKVEKSIQQDPEIDVVTEPLTFESAKRRVDEVPALPPKKAKVVEITTKENEQPISH